MQNKMISYYIIPKNVHYVQFIKEIETWTKTDKVDFNTPIVAVIEDSKANNYLRFVVIYKGLMQTQGGSGSCYNPCIPTYIHNQNPMDNSIMPQHMSKWITYNYSHLLKMVIAAKYELLEKLGFERLACRELYPEKHSNTLPFWYWDLEGYEGIQQILIAKLDAIGLGKADCSILKTTNNRFQPKLLTA